ncbi:MAG: hypothetical protein V9G98_14005 [Candidatus Competibacter sp.]
MWVVGGERDGLAGAGQGAVEVEFGLLDPAETEVGDGGGGVGRDGSLGGRARGVLAILYQGDYGPQAVGGGVVRVER